MSTIGGRWPDTGGASDRHMYRPLSRSAQASREPRDNWRVFFAVKKEFCRDATRLEWERLSAQAVKRHCAIAYRHWGRTRVRLCAVARGALHPRLDVCHSLSDFSMLMKAPLCKFIKLKEGSMSNLKSARQAIQAELEHARQGVLYYQMRVDALEEALAKLDSVETVNGRASGSSASGSSKGGNKPAGQAKRGRKARSHPTENGAQLPPTGKGFWPNLVTAEPQSAKEILNAAIKALHISPTKESIKKLSQRQAAALNGLVKTKRVADSGSGRERRFFRLQ